MSAGGGGRLLHRGRRTTREAEVRAAEHAKSLGASSSEAKELGGLGRRGALCADQGIAGTGCGRVGRRGRLGAAAGCPAPELRWKLRSGSAPRGVSLRGACGFGSSSHAARSAAL